MSEIKLQPDEARNYATDVKNTETAVTGDLNSLRNRMNNLTDSFTGKSQEAFIAKLDEWKTSSDSLMEALQGLGGFLENAANTIEDTDTQIAASLAG